MFELTAAILIQTMRPANPARCLDAEKEQSIP